MKVSHLLPALAALLTRRGRQRRNRPHRAAHQDLLADHDRGNRRQAKTVREGRHHRGADDLPLRRRNLRRPGGGRRRHHPRSAFAGLGRPQEGRDEQDRRQCRDGQFRLAADGAGQIDPRRQGPQRQEGRGSPRRARAPICWRCGPSRTARSTSPACRSAAAAWCRTCSPAMSTPPWSIRRLSYQISKSGEAQTLIDYYAEVPSNLTGGWIVTDKFVAEKPQVVQKALNALYGARRVHARQPRRHRQADRRAL